MVTKKKTPVKKQEIKPELKPLEVNEELEHLEFIQESNKFLTVVYDINWKKFQKKYNLIIQNLNTNDKNFREYIKKHTKSNEEIINNYKKNLLFLWSVYCKVWNKFVNKEV
jgi:hypothetical protein